MDSTPILLTIFRHQPRGLPLRQLDLECQLSHQAPFAICLLDAWLEIQTPTGIIVSEGRLLYTKHNRIQPALLRPSSSTLASIIIPLSAAVLKKIEEQRAGGDLVLVVSSRVQVCESIPTAPGKTQEVLGVPYESHFHTNQHSDHVEYKIPQSDWVKALRGLNWSELELIEFPAPTGTASPALNRAMKRLDDALDHYRRGSWEDSMASCRKAFEAVIKDATGNDDLSQAEAAFLALVPDPEKARLINDLVKTFAPFLHLGRHELARRVPIGPKDALLALHLTASLLAYFAQ